MKPYTDLLVILDAFIHDKAPVLDKDTDFAKLYSLSSIHSIIGIIGYMSYQYPFLISSPWKEKFQYESAKAVGIMSLKEEQLKVIESLFQQKGISYVLFKGSVIKDVYPIPELRTYGDVDILIHPKDRETVHKCFMDNGFVCRENWEPVYSYKKPDSIFEVHTELLDTKLTKCNDFFNQSMWNFSIGSVGNRYIFTDEFHFVYLIAHLAKHVKGSGAGIRMILDLALMIEHRDLDFVWIESTLDAIGLKPFSNYIFAFLVKYLNCCIQLDFEIPGNLSLFMEYIMQAGTFGKVGRDDGASALKNSNDSKMIQILRFIFPKAATISTRYTYLRKYPFLIPVAWLHRCLLTVSNTRRHLSHIQHMAQADPKEVDLLKKLNKDLGL